MARKCGPSVRERATNERHEREQFEQGYRMATKEDLRRATFTRLAGLCNKIAESPAADSDTVNGALELRKELLAFSRWVGPQKTPKQVESEEEALRTRAVNFLYAEQTYWM